jgi:hypothetical protein
MALVDARALITLDTVPVAHEGILRASATAGRGPIPVVGGEDRLLGVIPRATALSKEERPS